jgi:hypothetical protein
VPEPLAEAGMRQLAGQGRHVRTRVRAILGLVWIDADRIRAEFGGKGLRRCRAVQRAGEDRTLAQKLTGGALFST